VGEGSKTEAAEKTEEEIRVAIVQADDQTTAIRGKLFYLNIYLSSWAKTPDHPTETNVDFVMKKTTTRSIVPWPGRCRENKDSRNSKKNRHIMWRR
jgi:hypothetical protein